MWKMCIRDNFFFAYYHYLFSSTLRCCFRLCSPVLRGGLLCCSCGSWCVSPHCSWTRPTSTASSPPELHWAFSLQSITREMPKYYKWLCRYARDQFLMCSAPRCFLLPPYFALSPLKFWQAMPSKRWGQRHMHLPSSRVSVPPLWQGLHLHTLYSAR